MTVSINSLPVHVIKSSRKTISIELKTDEILVRAPKRMCDAEIQTVIAKKRSWIEKHYSVMQERQNKFKQLAPYTKEELNELTEKARTIIPQKVKTYAERIGTDYGHITIRHQRTRWGSCSSKGNLNFNCLLMLFPDEVIDSVVVHELCHRKHMNHSAAFYREVETAFPQYYACQKWLKENGAAYLYRLSITSE
ncbi:MAG: M48 family metallopeptidase [Peptococcaceae bacterium]|nr:M48 family metallopeptidase [Peptococcaceae bacterium]